MVYEMSVIFTGEYVEAHSTGDKSYQTSLQLWREISKVCQEHNCFKVLGIANSTTGIPISASAMHPTLFKELSITHHYQIAWVELNRECTENVKFLETFIKNRGLVNGKLFQNVEDAKKWLLDN